MELLFWSKVLVLKEIDRRCLPARENRPVDLFASGVQTGMICFALLCFAVLSFAVLFSCLASSPLFVVMRPARLLNVVQLIYEFVCL